MLALSRCTHIVTMGKLYLKGRLLVESEFTVAASDVGYMCPGVSG
jgi:hypothetical protein